MAKPEQPGCGWSRRTLLAGSAALAGGMLAGRSAEARSPAPPTPAAFWGGINQGTGFMPDDPYLSTCIRASDALGLRTVRQGMDTVGGATEGAAFDWRRRDAAFARYRAAGYRIHAVISFRNHVARPSRAQWERNWRYFVRAVMQRYQDQVAIWIIDNEPELRLRRLSAHGRGMRDLHAHRLGGAARSRAGGQVPDREPAGEVAGERLSPRHARGRARALVPRHRDPRLWCPDRGPPHPPAMGPAGRPRHHRPRGVDLRVRCHRGLGAGGLSRGRGRRGGRSSIASCGSRPRRSATNMCSCSTSIAGASASRSGA